MSLTAFFSNLSGTPLQWSIFVAALTACAGVVTVLIRTAPDRRRAENEAKVIDNTEAALLRAEYTQMHETMRKRYHDLANEFQGLVGTQRACEKRLAEAHAENRGYRDDMRTLLFLARLLIKEIRRLDPDPNNIIIDQAEMTLSELEAKNSPALEAKTPTRAAAEQTLHAAEHTIEVIDKQEGAGA